MACQRHPSRAQVQSGVLRVLDLGSVVGCRWLRVFGVLGVFFLVEVPL